ncbi:hypothetical protein [Ornithinibacillus scapharcae]|uniref:hypothetical protein n=1 Tax=Ornithinibacillus scapharcae TaxID=1147159 RepID=UPI000225B007|nr:hypothetical protein [Ornithinibacillus scapharcae]
MKDPKWLLGIVMVTTLVSSFVLIFTGLYKIGVVVGGIFLFLAAALSIWYSNKNEDYVHQNSYVKNSDRRRHR